MLRRVLCGQKTLEGSERCPWLRKGVALAVFDPPHPEVVKTLSIHFDEQCTIQPFIKTHGRMDRSAYSYPGGPNIRYDCLL